ncbi:MAG: CRTAC1 family protein [Acidobacteria bacterium]|nr:MAG: CRTAC1 family protein [Acidobacteriota bacterium]
MCIKCSLGRRTPKSKVLHLLFLMLALLLPACQSKTETEKPAARPPETEAGKPREAQRGGSATASPEARAGGQRTTPPVSPPLPMDGFLFTDMTGYSGVVFKHFNDATPRKYLPETMGAGVALLDYDNDGRLDIYLVNGARLKPPRDVPGAPTGALYRNLGNWKFQAVTAQANLEEPMFGMGAAVGDYNNDGFIDLFISGVDGDRLYRNAGNGKFEDVSEAAGLNDAGFGSSAAFLDYDRDGYLDLFVGRYVEWTPETDITCSPDGVHRVYCTPEAYHGESNRLYKNLGGRRFKDVTRSSGIWLQDGKTLGVAIMDHNRDSWPDIAVANDTVRNFLFVNNRDGTFTESGVTTGMAYSESGATRGGMGIDVGDADGDGFTDIAVGNFSQEMSALYRGSAPGFFVDDAPQAGIGLPTLMTLAFGTLFVDYDNDGLLDLLFVNGHIEPEINKTQRLQQYAQPSLLFKNESNNSFRPMTDQAGSPLGERLVGRGLASGDLDGDGDLDIVITQNGHPAKVWRNNAPRQSWIRLQLIGSRSNRTAYGAVVKAVAGKKTWVRMFTSGRSYLSACEPVVTIGLGATPQLDRLEITWPSGQLQTIERPALNQVLKVKEVPAAS